MLLLGHLLLANGMLRLPRHALLDEASLAHMVGFERPARWIRQTSASPRAAFAALVRGRKILHFMRGSGVHDLVLGLVTRSRHAARPRFVRIPSASELVRAVCRARLVSGRDDLRELRVICENFGRFAGTSSNLRQKILETAKRPPSADPRRPQKSFL